MEEDSPPTLEGEFTASSVEQAIVQMYSHNASGPDSHQQEFLTQAVSSPAAWTFSWQLISPEKPVEVQFMGARCLHAKVSYDWNELEPAQHEQLRLELRARLVQSAAFNRCVVTKLCQVVAAAAIQQRASSTSAPSPVSYILSFYSATEKSDSQTFELDCRQLEMLTMLPEEYRDMKLVKMKRLEINGELQKGAPQVMEWLQELFLSDDEPPAQCQRQIVACFGSWLDIRMELEAVKPLMEMAFLSLESVDVFEAAVDVVVKLFGSSFIKQCPHTVLRLLQNVNEVREMAVVAFAQKDMDTLSSLCRLVVAAGESYPLEIIEMLLKKGETRDTAIALLENIMTIAFPPGQYLLHENISTMSFGFWYSLQESLRNADGDAESLKEVMDLLKCVYRSLMEVLLTKLQYPDQSQWDQWDDDQREEFESYRQQIRETMVCCYDVLLDSVMQYLCDSLQSLVEKNNHQPDSVKWQELEAVLTAFRTMVEAGDNPTSPYPTVVMKLLPCVQFSHPKVLAAAISVIGVYCDWEADGGDLMCAVFPVVLGGLQQAETAPSAAVTLYSLVGSPLLPRLHGTVSLLLSTIQEVLGSDWVQRRECELLMKHVGSVLSRLPIPDTRAYLEALLSPRLHLLQQVIQQGTNRDEDQLVLQVDLLSTLFSCLHTYRTPAMLPGDMEDVEAEREDMDFQRPNLVSELLERIFPIIKELVSKWKTRPAIVEAVNKLFIGSLGVLRQDFRPMADSVANLMLEMFEVTPHASILNLVDNIVMQFEYDATFKEYISLLVNVICSRMLQSFEQIKDDPEVLRAFNILMSNMLSRSRHVLLSSGINMEHVLKFGVYTLMAGLGNVVRAGCFLLTAFLSASRQDDKLGSIVHNNMHFIVGTVLEVMCSGPDQVILEVMADTLEVCCKYQLTVFSAALKDGLPCVKGADKDGAYFAELFIRNQRNRIMCRELVAEFALKFRGLYHPGHIS
ncbi:importin-13-like [Babylonia areolata]|uniref:importin-13-like n=1 Tax=Babylonia areolata TaxID=304850 RepID=UPI003FCF10B1